MKFKKEIVTEGLYVTGDGKGGRRTELVTRDRLQHWATQHNEMKKLGIKLPAPEAHIREAQLEDPRKLDGLAWSQTPSGSKSNYGFWEDMKLVDSRNGQGIKAMEGIIDVPHEDDAKRIGKSVTDTSIFVVPEFIDGEGRIWKDVLSHVALVTKPIEPGQRNFEPVGEGELSIAMSHRLPIEMDMNVVSNMLSNDDDADVNDLYDMLEKIAGIAIPRGMAPEDLERALKAALMQKQLSESSRDGGTVTKPPKNSTLNEVPVVMSVNQISQGADQQMTAPNKNNGSQNGCSAGSGGGGGASTETIPPDRKHSMEMSHVAAQNAGLLNLLTSNKKTELTHRLNALKQRGVITDENFEKQLQDEIGSVQMSFDNDNQPVKSPVEYQIAALESVKIKMPPNQPMMAMGQLDELGNMVIQPNPTPAHSDQLSDDEAEAIVNNLFGNTPV